MEEMSLLYAAVAQGCQAGRHQEAFELYWTRISRAHLHFSWNKLGAFGADLAALSGFFQAPWREPVAGLSEASQGCLLDLAGFDLRALGRLPEAVGQVLGSLSAAIAHDDWDNAAVRAGNASLLQMNLGQLKEGLALARQGLDLAHRTSNETIQVFNRMVLATVLHRLGRLSETMAVIGAGAWRCTRPTATWRTRGSTGHARTKKRRDKAPLGRAT